MKFFLTPVILFIIFNSAFSASKDTTQNVKTGWNFGAVPAIAYDSDIGFKYGGVVNFYNYGNGETYPEYYHSIYLEWSRTTKGSGISQIEFDSEHLIPGIRVSGELSYLTEKALDFYGFNGYKTLYNTNLEDDSSNEYLSRVYYRLERQLLKFRSEFHGKTGINNLNWITGLSYYHQNIDSVDVNNLNKGKDKEDLLPYANGGLYGEYLSAGIIPDKDKNGGDNLMLRIGAIYDTRDNEPNPMKGIWTGVQFFISPAIKGVSDYSFTKLVINHRQYFTLIPRDLNLAIRLSYQDKLFGKMPFYMLPFLFNSAPTTTRDGLGGAKTLRGILRNRIVGEDYLYGNIELRYKFYHGMHFKQNIYAAIGTFLDGGMVTSPYKVNNANNLPSILNNEKEVPHLSAGLGLYAAMNENFIVNINYGKAFDKRDGNNGLYIGLNFLY